MGKGGNKKQPGMLLYFDVRRAIDRLTDTEAGILFKAAFSYAMEGVLPDLNGQDRIVLSTWDALRDALDRDAASYRAKLEANADNGRYGAHVRWANSKGLEVLPRSAWEKEHSGAIAGDSGAIAGNSGAMPVDGGTMAPDGVNDQLQPNSSATSSSTPTAAEGVSGEPHTEPLPSSYSPPPAEVWNRLKAEKMAAAREFVNGASSPPPYPPHNSGSGQWGG